jgi:hypothetical protein
MMMTGHRRATTTSIFTMRLAFKLQLVLLINLLYRLSIVAHPSSKPYIPFRTNPFDPASGQHHELVWDDSPTTKSTVRFYRPEVDDAAKKDCPFQFSLGVSTSSGSASVSVDGADPILSATAKAFGIIQPPVIFPIHPSQGPGRQVLYTTQYEHLNLLSPVTVSGSSGGRGVTKEDAMIKEGLAQLPDFPLLFESSSFLTSPLVHDVNGDGIPDAILSDYDGGIYMIGLYAKPGTKRYFHRAQVPRLFVRRNWVEERLKEATPHASQERKNETPGEDPHDPYHSYFEYTYTDGSKTKGDVLQGVTANVLGQDTTDLKGLVERRSRLVKPEPKAEAQEQETEPKEEEQQVAGHTDQHHRRLQSQEVSANEVKEDGSQVVHAATDGKKEFENAPQQQIITEHEQPKQEQQTDVSKQDVALGAQHLGIENEAPKQEPVTETQKQEPKEAERNEPKEAPKHLVGADSPKEAQQAEVGKAEPPKQEPEVANSDKQAGESVVQMQVPETDIQKQALSQDQATEVQIKAPEGRVENQAPEAVSSRQTTPQADEQKQGKAGAKTEREVLGADARQNPAQNADAQKLLQHDSSQQQVPGSDPHNTQRDAQNNAHGSGAQVPITGTDTAGDSASKDAKVDDQTWEQIRGGEGGGSWDDAAVGHEDKPTAMKSKDLGDDYKRYPKDDEVRAYGGYDDYYGDRMGRVRERESYYDDKHYVRLPPHILAAPVIAEVPKQYDSNNAVEEILLVPVSYYMDEDEYDGLFSYRRFEHTDHGDETEVKRGMYVASALMVYSLGESPRWGRQEHLDLSTDYTAPENATLMQDFPLLDDKTRMGAFALSSPTVADIDGDGTLEVLIGTSMGLVYTLDARMLYSKDGWPVQMQRPVETRILVEDVRGDTNLEAFIADVEGNVVCLDHKANKLWHRNLAKSVGVAGTDVTSFSAMTLGDVDGDGNLDLVLALGIKDAELSETVFVFALSAATGADVPNFPIAFKSKKRSEEELVDYLPRRKIPQPLLVDLHGDQTHLKSFLHRNGTKWTKRTQKNSQSAPHGGKAAGLHIVAPLGSTLYIIEAGSGCVQSIEIGDDIEAMVQADDVHGTNSLDLVVSTVSGNVITLESSSPFHPLNTWNHGEVRGSKNSFAHGYSASQGIFVHEESRQFRDIFGIYVPVTFEIFDNRPGIASEPSKRVYQVEVRDGTSSLRPILRKNYDATGKYTERVYIPYGPGFYTLTVVLKTTHGLTYEDNFHLGYNVHYMDGFGILLWLPLVAAAICIVICGRKKGHWDDDEFGVSERSGQNLGILGRATLPTSS